MSGGSSSAVAWYSLLEPASLPAGVERRPDDPRLGEIIEIWSGDAAAFVPGRAVLVGFPQDEGVRRNQGRAGAAAAPQEIRRHLARLTPWDPATNIDLRSVPPLDAGNVRIQGGLEDTQLALAEVVGGILTAGAVPIVLGGGHETAFGHYLGYVRAGRKVGIINVDAHLDVRPCSPVGGHSGSPFRQALEHPTNPLAGNAYVCLGAQPYSTSQAHVEFLRQRGGVVIWADQVRHGLERTFEVECDRLAQGGCHVYVTIDADVVRSADVPAVSAPNADGLAGTDVLACARRAGLTPAVASLDVVEINPAFDVDGRSARWASLVVWHFVVGLAKRRSQIR